MYRRVVAHDWRAWHARYDTDARLRARLEVVQRRIRDAIDAAPPGPVRVISMCAGQGRDLLGVLAEHPRAVDARGRLVELDPQLAADARASAPPGIEVACADASTSDAYAGAVPADLVLVCGVFGNVSADDVRRTVRVLPSLCAPGATVIWTRHRRPPDLTIDIRSWFADAGFRETAFDAPGDFLFGVGAHQLSRAPSSYERAVRMFTFVGYQALGES